MKILKSINRDPPTNPVNISLTSSTKSKIVKDKDKAELFQKTYAITSKKPKITKVRRKTIQQTKRNIRTYIQKENNDIESTLFTSHELNTAIKYLKRRKACGQDKIYNEFLIHSDETVKSYILLLLNLIWETGIFPRNFLNSIIIPIHKGGGKTTKDPNNYRPVALTSCLCKLMERLVLNRMIYIIESKNIFQDNQSAYRTARGILDPLIRLVAKINNGFNNSLSTLAIKLDLTSAFNHVEHDKLLQIMINLNLPQRYVKFYKGFLNDRRFKVKCNTSLSKSAKESCGSPQGTVSSPWLFLLYMEDLLRKIKLYNLYHEIEVGMFADNLTAFTTGKDLTTLEDRLSKLINKINKWNKDHNMKLSEKKGKCSTILLTNKKGTKTNSSNEQ